MKNKGFTLIELLAVIVILALVIAIAVPLILNTISEAKKGAMESDAKLVIDAINKRIAIDEKYNYLSITEENIETELGIKATNYEDLVVTQVNGKPRVLIVGQNKWEGYTAYGNYSSIDVVNSNNYDITPPVIALIGDNPLEIEQGSNYIEPGATANDNKDGNITGNIIIAGTVNKDTIGSYTITYTVKDELGNSAVLTRTVNVITPSYAGLKYVTSKGVNGPVLATGMVPIKWNGSAWVDTNIYDSAWYNYDTNKEWANARTEDGSLWVWIPRYIYKISSGWHTNTAGTIDVQFSKGIDDNWNNGVIGAIDTGTTSNASNNKWTNHPAFTFGTTELTGIWVAKFEATAAEGVTTNISSGTCSPADNVTTKTVKISASSKAWICMTVGNTHTVIRNMETNNTYGWGTTGTGIDTHLMKNIEWGVVAYLSKSSYGKNSEIWSNNSSTSMTGCAGTSVNPSTYSGCQYAFNTSNGQQSSTTGNTYGIYDMNGGNGENVAAYVNNGDSYLSNAGNLITDNAKYKDMYPVTLDGDTNNYNNSINKKGDAVYETSNSSTGGSSWYSDYSAMPATNNPCFTRSGFAGAGALTGAFAFNISNCSGNISYGFRPVLIVGDNL